MEPARPSLLLITSNGGGMGHLTRQLAVALAAGDRALTTMFSLSLALPVVTAYGLRGEYCPSHNQPWLRGWQWDLYLRDRIVAIAKETAASAIAFDGVAPYHGLVAARSQLPRTAFVWVRRGMWRWGSTKRQLVKSALFDMVIQPGDLAEEADRGPTAGRSDAVRIPPITMLDVVQRLPRAAAARELRIDAERPTLLVTLGSGRLGEVEAPGEVVLRAALEHRDWQICVTAADIATSRIPLVDPGRVVQLAGVYPLVRYLDAFDVVVSAAGYNAVHEFIAAGVPTLLVPNPSTLTDDQVARAHELARAGVALCADPTDASSLARATARLLDSKQAAALASACAGLSPDCRSGGARATAGLLLDLAAGRESGVRPLLGLRLRLYGMARQLLRLSDANLARQGSGRSSPTPDSASALPTVRIIDDPHAAAGHRVDGVPLLFTDRISPDILRRDHPVEHFLEGSSPGYRAERRRIIERFYTVLPEPSGPEGR